MSLPTEEEWEKAARGVDGLVYPWGNDWQKNRANTAEAKIEGTTPVGQFSPQGDSPFGCVDMCGNVWEYCLNKYANPQDIQIDQSGDLRVVRGGSWSGLHFFARAASRTPNDPSYRVLNYGFRVVGRSPS